MIKLSMTVKDQICFFDVIDKGFRDNEKNICFTLVMLSGHVDGSEWK